MKITPRQDNGGDGHLPKFPLHGGMAHIGLVDEHGQVILTVWNHHYRDACWEIAEAVKNLLESGGWLIET